ncbi:hypothetical protein AFLA_004854 [Aspergillus flavus NRRL3357]|nr:hypothetical protein AFLA_004854 [Aspergillus flavus NRRL3357]
MKVEPSLEGHHVHLIVVCHQKLNKSKGIKQGNRVTFGYVVLAEFSFSRGWEPGKHVEVELCWAHRPLPTFFEAERIKNGVLTIRSRSNALHGITAGMREAPGLQGHYKPASDYDRLAQEKRKNQ